METDQVWVSLTENADGITVAIKDQGDGFELDKALRKGGIGFISMEERVRAENGTLTIQSKPGVGTTVTAFVPVPLS
jgi:signal transduction histidine kinase